jgi:CheY-like chemotaxis protein
MKEASRRTGVGRTILAVEDNYLNMELFLEILDLEGYTVHPVYDAEEALKVVCGLQPDLILLDIALPGMDGLTALRLLKADPETRNIPIVVVSAHSMLTDEKAAREAGCSEYLTKPISTGALLATVAEYIRKPSEL